MNASTCIVSLHVACIHLLIILIKDSNKVKTATEEEHNAAIALMRTFMYSDKPKVGIFWYDFVNNSLFGVSKIEPELLSTESETITCPETHEIYWQNQHRIAIAKNNTMSIYYNNDNYAKIPKGRVILENGTFYAIVGSWINESDVIDSDKLRELIVDEFDLPEDFIFKEE